MNNNILTFPLPAKERDKIWFRKDLIQGYYPADIINLTAERIYRELLAEAEKEDRMEKAWNIYSTLSGARRKKNDTPPSTAKIIPIPINKSIEKTNYKITETLWELVQFPKTAQSSYTPHTQSL